MKNRELRDVGRAILNGVDMFSFDVQFRENRQEKFTTYFGSVMSLFIIILVGYYSYIKFLVLISYGDTKFQEIEEFVDEIQFEGGNDKNFPIGLLYIDFMQDNNVFAGFNEFTPIEELGT